MTTSDFSIKRRILVNKSDEPGTKEQKKESRVKSSTLFEKILVLTVMLFCIEGTFLISRLLLVHASIRLDESQSLWQTSHSFLGTLQVVATDVHVPLYHLMLHFWQIYVGNDIETARLLSYGFFVLTMPFFYLLARKILSVRWSLFALVLFSFSPFMNWYANEARMYTLLALVATVSSYFFVNLIESHGKKGWIGYTLSCMIGVYSHYFFLFLLMSQAIYFLFNRRSFEKGTFRRLTAVAILLIIELAPWLIYFRSLGSASNTSPQLPLPSSVDFFNVFSNFSFGFQTDAVNTILVSTWPILVVVSLLMVKRGQKVTRKVGYIVAAAFLPVVLAFVISYLAKPFFVGRYMTASLIPLTIIIVWLVSNYRRRLAVIVSAVLVGLVIVSSGIEYTSAATPVKEDYRAASNYISEHSKAQDVIVLTAPFTIYPFQYYYQGSTAIQTLPAWNRSEPGAVPAFQKSKLESQVNDLKKGHQYVYLLLSYDQGYQEDVYQYFEQHFQQTDEKQFSPDVKLYVYRVGYSEIKSYSP